MHGHSEHLELVNRLAQTGQPAIVLAARGMCQGGRIVNYLQAMLDKPKTDIIFVGYQANGTLGRAIQLAEPGEAVQIFEETRPVNAHIHRLSGFSAHADQKDLMNFATGIPKPPEEIRLVHGDPGAKKTLKNKLEQALPETDSYIAEG